MMLRHNHSQMTVAEFFMVSQATISRIWRRITALLETILLFTPGGDLTEAIREGHLLVVDGTYIPTGNRPASRQGTANYSGKRRLQCLAVQVAATDQGDLIAVSDPVPGARHDAKAIEMCGWKTILEATNATWIAGHRLHRHHSHHSHQKNQTPSTHHMGETIQQNHRLPLECYGFCGHC